MTMIVLFPYKTKPQPLITLHNLWDFQLQHTFQMLKWSNWEQYKPTASIINAGWVEKIADTNNAVPLYSAHPLYFAELEFYSLIQYSGSNFIYRKFETNRNIVK